MGGESRNKQKRRLKISSHKMNDHQPTQLTNDEISASQQISDLHEEGNDQKKKINSHFSSHSSNCDIVIASPSRIVLFKYKRQMRWMRWLVR